MADFTTAKSIFVLSIVVGCFALLWPRIFLPMLQGSLSGAPGMGDYDEACCDVIFERDITALKALKELCNNIEESGVAVTPDPTDSKQLNVRYRTISTVELCSLHIKSKCGIDVTNLLTKDDSHKINKKYRTILDQLRSYNVSQCFKDSYGINPSLLGTHHHEFVATILPPHMRPERSAQLRHDFMHPALREKGRAIFPQSTPQRTIEKDQRPGPIPGLRPPVGGSGHVAQSQKGSGTMGIIMPIYTIGIVLFFMYTIMRVLFRKPEEKCAHKNYPKYNTEYTEVERPPRFRKQFSAEKPKWNVSNDKEQAPPKLDEEMNSMKTDANEDLTETDLSISETQGDEELAELRRRLQETEAAMEKIVSQISSVSTSEQIPHVMKAIEDKQKKSPTKTASPRDPQKPLDAAGNQVNKHPEMNNINNISRDYDEESTSEEEIEITDDEDDLITANDHFGQIKTQSKLAESFTRLSLEDLRRIPSMEDSKVAVLGIETTASIDDLRKYNQQDSPSGQMSLIRGHSRSTTPIQSNHTKSPSPPVILDYPVSSQTQLLVSESDLIAQERAGSTEASNYESAPVIISGRMTLSLIGMEASSAIHSQSTQGHHTYLNDVTSPSESLPFDSNQSRRSTSMSDLPRVETHFAEPKKV